MGANSRIFFLKGEPPESLRCDHTQRRMYPIYHLSSVYKCTLHFGLDFGLVGWPGCSLWEVATDDDCEQSTVASLARHELLCIDTLSTSN